MDKGQEATAPTRAFMPNTDIFETEDALTVVLEMPGVDRDRIGPYRRSFRISNQIDQDKIGAEMRDGVIKLVLPKAEQAKRAK